MMGRLILMSKESKLDCWNGGVQRDFYVTVVIQVLPNTVRPALSYSIEGWIFIKRHQTQEMSIVEMHIFYWMCSNNRKDKDKKWGNAY